MKGENANPQIESSREQSGRGRGEASHRQCSAEETTQDILIIICTRLFHYHYNNRSV